MDTIKRTLGLKFTYVGLFVGACLALLSFTPSLLPRGWILQGALSGIALAFGYGIGNMIGASYRFFELPDASKKFVDSFKKISVVAGVLLLILFLINSLNWSNSVRELVGMKTLDSLYPFRIILLALFLAYLIVVISRMLRGVVRTAITFALKVLPAKLAKPVGLVIGTLFIILFFNGVILDAVASTLNAAFSTRDGTTDEGVEKPTSSNRSGSDESLVAWDTLGRQGRKFTGGGPSAEMINEFSGGQAKDPIRIYVGLKSDDSIEARADLALQELIRTNAFSRDILIVATTTGTGWLDPGAVDTVEYVHNGDSAIVGLQYSYLPSWISLFVDQQITIDTANATLNAVHDYWSTLDEKSRPELYLFGLSLGSFGSQASASNLRLVNVPIDGALWVGSPFVSEAWADLTDNRDEGSPAWRPIIDQGRVVEETGPRASRNLLQTESLLTAIEKYRFDVVFGGARRDEEKARAKERVFSFRDEFGQWDPKSQRPELWSLYNGRHHMGEHMRVFPISNWTEMDVWQYIKTEEIELPSVYFSHRRKVFERDGMLMAESPFLRPMDGESVFEATVRFRTVGDMSCTGAFESTASTLSEIIDEVSVTRITERGASRADDRRAEAAMEDRKKEGYF